MADGISNKDGTTEQYRSCIGHDTCLGPKSPPCLTREYQDSCPYNRGAAPHPTIAQQAKAMGATCGSPIIFVLG